MLSDQEDSSTARRLALVLGLVGVVWIVSVVLALFTLSELMSGSAQGVGLQEGAIYAFLLSSTLMLAFALVAGDGLLGEVQYVIAGFLVVFFVAWAVLVLVF